MRPAGEERKQTEKNRTQLWPDEAHTKPGEKEKMIKRKKEKREPLKEKCMRA